MAASWRCERVSEVPTMCSFLMLAFLFALSAIPMAAAYGLDDFMAAINDYNVTYHEVKGDVVLNASLPQKAFGRSFTLVGKAPGGRRPVIDGAFKEGGLIPLGLTLRNLEFRNFNGTQPIFSALGHDVDVQDCVFRGNRVAGGGTGSAVFVLGGNLRISRSSFFGNQVAAQGSGGSAGAVYSQSAGSVLIDSTVFLNNQLTGAGGMGDGGALSIPFATLYMITNCTFDGNRVDGIGGAIASSGCGRGEILRSSFLRNFAFSTKGAYKRYATGGAIDIYGDNVTVITGCSFTGNKAAGRRGGAVSLSMYQAEATISGSKFEQNAAGTYGGAVGVRLVPGSFSEGRRSIVLYDGGPPRSRVKFCRGNTYSRNVAGSSGAENIYVDMRNSSVSGVTFCPSEPPLALIEAETGTVNVTCASC
ncbi:hypothetical protein CBR_g34418 [Chara braunii]|uniref:Right handed beta helix domain-containing protein n=1 Tax=Chara braunii TaxID=69332 RepID=A0A388LIN7_CHABU|nr:hypothetical protein CBR_g34418 [Chara braunii]|eukprot:GBG82137.1 hypothetical protein CBR_g34418 [Chara braunii]